jgi:hypothetical protein
MPASIVDFDLTLTKEHTFPSCNLDVVPWEIRENAQALINFGAMHAKDNLRPGAKGHAIFNFTEFDIFAIATHHNNPDFIAGYAQEILDRKVTLKANKIETHAFANGGRIGIKNYIVDGTEKPLLIAYIPERSPTFSAVRAVLQGKNEMIITLLNIWQALDLWPQRIVHFYDDDKKNIHYAEECLPASFGKIIAHPIDTSILDFANCKYV